MKHFVLVFFATCLSFAAFAQPPIITITGDSVVCIGNTITFTTGGGITTLGTWHSSDVTIATATPATGLTTVVRGIATGVVLISYTSGVTTVTKSVTVDPAVGSIMGPMAYCTGGTGTMLDATIGGTWTSGTTSVATIGSLSGSLSAISAGTSSIAYTVSPGCHTSVTVTVGVTPPITGPDSICVGSSTTLSDASPGGTWSSTATSVGTIDPSSGSVAGISAGVTTISYAPTTGCGATNMVLTVVTTPAAITGPTEVCEGLTITLHDGGGGTWSGTPPLYAAIGVATGVVTGISPGAFVVTYTLAAGCTATTTVTVTPLPTSFPLTGGGSYCSGGAGLDLILSGSATGTSYQLFYEGTATGLPLSGTGSSLDFGFKTAMGDYTVLATSVCSDSTGMSTSITVNPLPAPFTITGGGSVCVGGSGVHIGLSGSESGVSYQLFNGLTAAGSPVSGTGAALDFGPFVTSGTYSITATNSTTGCVSDMTGTVTITLNPTPAAVMGTAIVCTGLSRTLTDATAGGVWSSSHFTIATVGSTTGVVDGIAPGTDTVTYTVTATGCTAVVVVTVTPTPCSSTIVDVTTIPYPISVYPNPAANELTISLFETAFSDYVITNAVGQVIKQGAVTGVTTKVDTRALPTGVFYVTLKGDQGAAVQKFAIMRAQ